MNQPQAIEDFIAEAFEQNYERIRLETGRAVTPNIKAAAKEQVLLYYRRMRDVAEGVTDTEVKLTLPEQHTPKGRKYTLEGVVDIVREADKTIMYDVKTHLDAESARGQLGQYIQQLNVYAHIWHGLRGEALDETAIIATRPTRELRQALRSGQDSVIATAISQWQPCIDIPLDAGAVDETVQQFGAVIDAIEERKFRPPPVEKLKTPIREGGRQPFGSVVCTNCDVRFTCDSYRQFRLQTAQGMAAERVIHATLNEYAATTEAAQWIDANMETLNRNTLPGAEDVDRGETE